MAEQIIPEVIYTDNPRTEIISSAALVGKGVKMNFNEFAKQKRLQAKLTQQQCADALNLNNRNSFCRLETGNIQWKLVYLEKFATLLNIKLSELFGEFEGNSY